MKKSVLSFLCLFFFLSFSPLVLAQEEASSGDQQANDNGAGNIKAATVVSRVGFNNAKLILQKDNLFRVYFQLLNPGAPETDIRYGFHLEKKVGEGKYVLADEFFFDEVLSVSPEQSIIRQVDYLAPDFFSGEYRLWIVAKQSAGQFRGITFLGEVSLSGTDQYVEIERESCFLKISGEDKKYTLGEGVSFLEEEEVFLDCMVKNKTGKKVDVKGDYLVFRRSISTETAEATTASTTWTDSLLVGERKAIVVKLPIPSEPQAYDVKFFLTSEGKTISNSVVAHYVLAGESATIETALFDKSQYQPGDQVSLTVSWLEAADNFLGSRIAGTDSQGLKLKVILKDKDDRACSEEVVRNDLDQNKQEEKIELSMKGDCPQMKAVVSLLGRSDQELDRREFGFAFENQAEGTLDDLIGSKQKESKTKAVGLIIFLLFLPLLVWLVLRFRKKRGTNLVIFLALVSFSLLGFSGLANADTQTLDIYLSGSSCSGDMGYRMLTSDPMTWKETKSSCTYNGVNYCVDYYEHCSTTGGWATSTVSTNKNEYNPGETITVSASGSFNASCSNPVTSTVQVGDAIVASNTSNAAGTYSNNGSINLTAPSTPGDYTIQVALTYTHPPFYFLEYANLHYSVVNNVATCGASFNPAAITVPDSSTLTWWTNNADRLYFQCSGPLTVSYRSAGSLSGSSNVPFVSPGGTETCIFTPFKGWIAGTPCPATVDVRYCIGTIPSGSTMCPGDDANLWRSLAWVGVGSAEASCSHLRKCEYYTPGVPFSCAGTPPDGVTQIMCSEDNINLTGAASWANIGTTSASCTAATKCEYYTPSVVYSCGGTPPNASTQIACPDDSIDLTGAASWTNVGTTSASCTATKCEYYTPVTPYSCAGTAPNGLTEFMCPDDNIDLTGAASWTNVGTSSASCTATKCEYYVPSTPYSCIGTPPDGVTKFMCSEDNLNLTETLPWLNVGPGAGSCSARKCEYFENACVPFCFHVNPCSTGLCDDQPNICQWTCDSSDCVGHEAYCNGTTPCGPCSDGNWEEREPF